MTGLWVLAWFCTNGEPCGPDLTYWKTRSACIQAEVQFLRLYPQMKDMMTGMCYEDVYEGKKPGGSNE